MHPQVRLTEALVVPRCTKSVCTVHPQVRIREALVVPWCTKSGCTVHKQRPGKTLNLSMRFCTVLRHIKKIVDINFHAKKISIFFFYDFFPSN